MNHVSRKVESVWIMNLSRLVWQNAGLNLLLFFCDITKQILTVSLDQHWKILPISCAMLPSGLWPSGKHYTTSGQNFSVLTLAPVNICILLHSVQCMCVCIQQSNGTFVYCLIQMHFLVQVFRAVSITTAVTDTGLHQQIPISSQHESVLQT